MNTKSHREQECSFIRDQQQSSNRTALNCRQSKAILNYCCIFIIVFFCSVSCVSSLLNCIVVFFVPCKYIQSTYIYIYGRFRLFVFVYRVKYFFFLFHVSVSHLSSRTSIISTILIHVYVCNVNVNELITCI